MERNLPSLEAEPPGTIALLPMLNQMRFWQAVIGKGRTPDGKFLCGVVTTKVFSVSGALVMRALKNTMLVANAPPGAIGRCQRLK